MWHDANSVWTNFPSTSKEPDILTQYPILQKLCTHGSPAMSSFKTPQACTPLQACAPESFFPSLHLHSVWLSVLTDENNTGNLVHAARTTRAPNASHMTPALRLRFNPAACTVAFESLDRKRQTQKGQSQQHKHQHKHQHPDNDADTFRNFRNARNARNRRQKHGRRSQNPRALSKHKTTQRKQPKKQPKKQPQKQPKKQPQKQPKKQPQKQPKKQPQKQKTMLHRINKSLKRVNC
ncbi:hypothetical protein OAM67_00495 [bacterium]|nr:hypothetical protein [bacterium]